MDLPIVKDLQTGLTIIVVKILEPKTRRKYGKVQHVICEEPLLVAALRKYLMYLDDADRLFPFTDSTFARRLKKILSHLNIEDLFTPGGLRPGGATAEWIRFRNFENLRIRGRWAISRTLEHYVQECVASLNTTLLSDHQMALLEEVSRHGLTMWLRYVR